MEKIYHPDHFRKVGHEMVEMLANYLEQCQNRGEMPISNPTLPENMLEKWQTDFSTPLKENEIGELFQNLLQDSTHLQHPNYIGHQVSAPIPLGGLAEMISGVINGSGSLYEMGAAASAMDKIVTDFMSKQCGYDDKAMGIVTSGGSLGNLTAFLAARQAKANYNAWEMGNQGQLAIMVSEESHYSVSRAVKIMGLGEAGLIKIPTDENFCIRPELLQEKYEAATAAGKQIIALVGNACSTSTGSFDDLEALGLFCKKHDIWFHVDGAHGGGAILSEKYKSLLKSIHQADSIVIDFHKMMLIPALATAVLFKNGSTSAEAFSQKAHYLAMEEKENLWYNHASRTFECTRPMLGVKVYSVLKAYGAKVIGDYITHVFDLGKAFANVIAASEDFELAVEPMCNIVCFRYKAVGNINDVNANLRQAIVNDGHFYIVQTTIKGNIYLRTTIINPHTTLEDLTGLLEKIRDIMR